MRCRYPLMLDVIDRLVVIVGGGAVAVRKAASLAAAGATRLRVVAPTIDASMPANVERIVASFSPQHLDGAALVFAATNDAVVNDRVVTEARGRNIFVSRVESEGMSEGDFVSPAVFRDGRITVAIAAGSPALSKLIRNSLSQGWQDGWAKMAEAMHALRPEIRRNHHLTPTKRREIFQELATSQAIGILDAGGIAALRVWLIERYPELSNA